MAIYAQEKGILTENLCHSLKQWFISTLVNVTHTVYDTTHIELWLFSGHCIPAKAVF